jgi:hypothetical protein
MRLANHTTHKYKYTTNNRVLEPVFRVRVSVGLAGLLIFLVPPAFF